MKNLIKLLRKMENIFYFQTIIHGYPQETIPQSGTCFTIDINGIRIRCREKKTVYDLQGGVRFPTGGKVHKPQGTTRCDSVTDGRVRMKEDKKRMPDGQNQTVGHFCRCFLFR